MQSYPASSHLAVTPKTDHLSLFLKGSKDESLDTIILGVNLKKLLILSGSNVLSYKMGKLSCSEDC